LLVLLPNLVLTGVGLVMSGQAQQVAEAQSGGHFGSVRFLRQVGLCAFLLLPTGIWVVRQRAGWTALGQAGGWGRERLGRAVLLGTLLGMGVLFLRGRPFEWARLSRADTWWALATYAVVALVEETLYRGFLQGRLGAWLGRGWGCLTTALLFTVLHLPARLLGGQPLVPALTYAAVRLLPMALLFGGTMLAAGHAAAPAVVHLAWNWASVIRR
jgi:membrane protease YdiL (CAAX protease family)